MVSKSEIKSCSTFTLYVGLLILTVLLTDLVCSSVGIEEIVNSTGFRSEEKKADLQQIF